MLWLMRWLSRRSLSTLHVIGAFLGWMVWALSPTYRRRLAEHVALAGFDAQVRHRAIAEAGRMVGELPWLWMRPQDQPLASHVRWQGDALIDDAVAKGRGLVFLTPHLGCWEVTAQAFAERWGATCPVTVMYRPARKPWLRKVEEDARGRPGLNTAPAALNGVRQMLRSLRRGQAVGLLPDQVPPEGMGVWAPFFGRPAYTMTLAARLAQQTGAALLLIWADRLPHGQGWLLRVSLPATPLPPAADDEAQQIAAATVVNGEMERLIRESPGQYLWGYHRYKEPRRQAASEPDGGAA